MMSKVFGEQSRNRFYTRFRAVNELMIARDEVLQSVCCLLVVPHLAHLSRLCRGRGRPCSRRLPARRAVFVCFSKMIVLISSVYSYV